MIIICLKLGAELITFNKLENIELSRNSYAIHKHMPVEKVL